MSQCSELRPTSSWERLVSLGTPANFNRFHVLATSFDAVNQTLYHVWPSPALVYYIHFLGLLPPNGILPHSKLTLLPSLAFSYIGTVNALHSSSGRRPNCGVQQRASPLFGRAITALGIYCIYCLVWLIIHQISVLYTEPRFKLLKAEICHPWY